MFERDGKNQHAFSIDMDTLGDVRNLCNVKPTVEWMDTVLHEAGHGVYSMLCDRSLPFNLRDPAHIFATEGVAMLFGAKARTPQWMIRFAGIAPDKANAVADALKKQRVREQLIFCRWTLVMLNFEKALYENPDADLKTLWWDMVEKYQLLQRPPDRHLGDWASKPHFVIAPVYYHTYMLGELFAAQLRSSLGKNDSAAFGNALTEKVFQPGMRYPWPEFVKRATGEPLSPKAFSKELK
jgi:peptidyl-dipeptidase A